MRRLRQDDPELYELKLFEWDYVASLGDVGEKPDLDIIEEPEVMFTLGVIDDEHATATTSTTASHQPGTSGTTGT